MSKFTILTEDEIAETHKRRAQEVFDIWGARDDSDWEDLIALVAEALQITENQSNGVTLEDEEEDEEVTVSSSGVLSIQ